MEQIITEFFAKSLHIILESRCPHASSRNYSGEQVVSSSSPSQSSSSSSSSSFRSRDKWFNLALRDCPAALDNIVFWRHSNLEPMIVDVILMQRPTDWDPLNFSPKLGLGRNSSGKERDYYGSSNDESGSKSKSGNIIERWILQYESKRSVGKNEGVSPGRKRSRSTSSHALYKKSILLLRSLYTTVRLLPAYKLFRHLISTAQIRLYNLGHRVSSFIEPFTRREEADMQRFIFTPIETSCGRLCLSVLYRSSIMDVCSEPSTPMSPQFISEYVGSPMAESLRRFPSPSSSPFGRRHSWSYDLYRASPPSVNPSPSPSPTYSETLANYHTCRLPPAGSSSPSSSPPTYVTDIHISKALLRSESAPVTIPSLPDKQLMLPSPPRMKPTGLTLSINVPNAGLCQNTSTVDKLFSFSKNQMGKMSVVIPSSHSSPSKSDSRSSNRLSFQDNYDDSEFSGPFIVDDDDMIDPSSRQGPFDQKSQDAAAVGALVRMLKKAPPLRQDVSVTTQYLHLRKCIHNNNNENENTREQELESSSRTTADALNELHGYREIKNLLLNKGKNSTS